MHNLLKAFNTQRLGGLEQRLSGLERLLGRLVGADEAVVLVLSALAMRLGVFVGALVAQSNTTPWMHMCVQEQLVFERWVVHQGGQKLAPFATKQTASVLVAIEVLFLAIWVSPTALTQGLVIDRRLGGIDRRLPAHKTALSHCSTRQDMKRARTRRHRQAARQQQQQLLGVSCSFASTAPSSQ